MTDEIEEIMDESEIYDTPPGQYAEDIQPENLVSYLTELCHRHNARYRTFVDVRAYLEGYSTYYLGLFREGEGCLGDSRVNPLIVKRLDGIDTHEKAIQWTRDMRRAFRNYTQTTEVFSINEDDIKRGVNFYVTVI